MSSVGKYRKFIVAVLGAAAVIAAELPPDAPSWLTGAFAVLSALAVFFVRNDRPVSREELKSATRPTTTGGYEPPRRPPFEAP
jgi:membrane protein implicated in regulation of membrane protease activity